LRGEEEEAATPLRVFPLALLGRERARVRDVRIAPDSKGR